ncbi:MAG: hydantoinase/oxoprolinase family protein [Calditrichaeota bacterium]|nr:MAG: hydantoinase/oxoprolinase family protein [Calditrichota bacterium]
MKKSDNKNPWQLWIDTGGTFTDCVAVDPKGEWHRVKVLSSSALRGIVEDIDAHGILHIQEKWQAPPDFIKGFQFKLLNIPGSQIYVETYDPHSATIKLSENPSWGGELPCAFEVVSSEEAPILAARLITGTPPHLPLPPMEMRLATTLGTNALLEKRGAPVVLFVTKGFADILLIGTQQRPDLFALEIKKPDPLYKTVVEVEERLASDGSVLNALNVQTLKEQINKLIALGIEVAAVSLMHSYLNPTHEHKLRDFLIKQGFKHVSCSSNLVPFIKYLPRTETTLVNAFLAPVIENYLRRVTLALNKKSRLHVMTSAGGLVQASRFHPKDSLLSGPAGGVVGAAAAARRSNFNKIIAFDMGGTSTDVARYDGDFQYVFEHQVGEAHLVAPALAIESVAAGGGSVCWFDGQRLRVGPESAGAQPGPACYGAGGPLTLTDVNLLLGRLQPARFEIPISLLAAQQRLQSLKKEVKEKAGEEITEEALLIGFLDIANERMADAIRRISVREGYNPADYVLVAFGGAGPQHACGVADRLGIQHILVPPDASLLSAQGLGYAMIERFAERQILQPLKKVASQLPQWLHELATRATEALVTEGVPEDAIILRRQIINLRFIGQDSVLSIEYDPEVRVEQAFKARYYEIFGHQPEGRTIEVESLRVVASSRPSFKMASIECLEHIKAKAKSVSSSFFQGKWLDVPIYERMQLTRGAHLKGPALIIEAHSTTVVDSGWQAAMDGSGAIVLTKGK